MRKKESVFRLLLALIAAVVGSQSIPVQAQTAVWQIPLTDYSSIVRFGPQLYQVTKNGQTGLIRSDGSVVVPVKAKRITGFYEHKALVLGSDGGRENILGILDDQGNYHAVNGQYFTLTGLDFCSDGMIPAASADGMPGYLDERGNAVLGFNGMWDRVMPFTEGHAAVFKNKKYSLIDKSGRPSTIIIGIGEVYGGTNMYQGQAVIWDTDGGFYTFNPTEGSCKKTKQPADTGWDYLYCFTGVTGRQKTVPLSSLSSAASLIQPIQVNGLYGYKTDANKTILPCQFTSASAFEDGIAIVGVDGKIGLLRYVEQAGTFNVVSPQNHYTYTPGGSVACGLQIGVPQVWRGKRYKVEIAAKGSNERLTCSQDGNLYKFTLYPEYTEKTFDVFIKSDGLTLWQGDVSYTFKRLDVNLEISIEMGNTTADRDGKVYMTVKIHNPSTESITATVEMRGSKCFESNLQTITLTPGGNMELQGRFNVTEDVDNQYVKVTSTAGGTASKTGLTLKKFQ